MSYPVTIRYVDRIVNPTGCTGYQNGRCALRLDLNLLGASGVVVDLGAILTTLIRPWKVEDRDNKEAVGRVGHASESVVPSPESGQTSKGAASLDATVLRFLAIVLEIANTQEEEGQVKPEEEQGKHNGRLERTEKEEEGEDEPSLDSLAD